MELREGSLQNVAPLIHAWDVLGYWREHTSAMYWLERPDMGECQLKTLPNIISRKTILLHLGHCAGLGPITAERVRRLQPFFGHRSLGDLGSRTMIPVRVRKGGYGTGTNMHLGIWMPTHAEQGI